ncbi:hypothetical protein C1886_22745 [Pseudomonas sp. FW300-N1A1]|uniref:hypothetical protein n=1 Tax=Pseudomonas sp. FW300-N1A1 TaxID=2075555 RepID=UPI000CD1BFAF|nr:hypothetical protein [Pseudomonas sp. FW300-N1A1]POA17264.1 hypothetical protein C1886_22745 [Pseudomonas sp. FW300-N1A1]
MSSTARIFEEVVAENSAASKYIDSLGDTSAITLLIPEASPEAPAAIIGADAIDFMALLRDHLSEDVSIKVCGDADSVHYSQLNSIIIDIGTYILSDVSVPLFVTVFGAYIHSKISQHNSEDIEVRIELIKGKGANKRKYRVSGRANAVLKVVKELEKK